MGKNSRWAGLSASHEQAGLGGSCPFLQHRAASNNNGISALLTAQRPTSLPLPHSPCVFFIILSFLFLSRPHKCTHDISMPEPSHRQMGIFSSTQTLLLFLPKWLEGLLTKEVCQAHSQQALPKKLYASPSLVSPKKPSPPWAVLPLHRLWIAAAERWHQEEVWWAKTSRLLPSRQTGHCL